jgi:hypothetical protein
VTDWQIHVPHRDRSDSLATVAGLARHLPAADRAVARQVAVDARVEHGLRTAGELIDWLEQLEPAQRRQLLDDARSTCGLEPRAEIEGRRQVEAASKAALATQQSLLQGCHAAGCTTVPTRDGGALREVDVVRWFCDQHCDQAAPGDMEPRPSPWRYSASGTIVEVDTAAEQRDAAAAESRRRQHDAKLAERAAEAAELAEHQDALKDQLQRELPPHLRALA